MRAGVRELKDNLSRYLKRVEAGEQVLVTAHGRVIAEIVRPLSDTGVSRFDQLIAEGVITPPAEEGDRLEGRPRISLPSGTASALIDADRDER